MKRSISGRAPAIGVLLITILALTLAMAGAAGAGARKGDNDRQDKPWSFGVMSDTQWTCPTDPAHANPNGVSKSIVDQINQQFIAKGVKFVVQVGDLTESGNDADIAMRAAAAAPLYKAGIGFFPMRGNHETYAAPANGYGIPAFRTAFPQTQGAGQTFGARNFSSPALAGSYPDDLKGMTYSFDYGKAGSNARFVILDDWATANKRVDAAGYAYGYSIADQQSWISSRLSKTTRGTQHAFVFSHQNLIGENHQDTLFNGYANANPDMQNAFFASMQDNAAKYYISGHDHIFQRSIVASPDGKSNVEELICASNSSKFYTPKAIDNANWFGQKVRETSVAQELYTVGYYIYTIDGPRVTVDYYSDETGNWLSDVLYPAGPSPAGTQITPFYVFTKKASWGYSLNGKEFLVGGSHDPSYAVVKDSYNGTAVSIIDGKYGNTATDRSPSATTTGRTLTQTVDTGWASSDRSADLDSAIVTLWGMTTTGATHTDPYVLAMKVDKRGCSGHNNGVLVSKEGKHRWVNTVDLNSDGSVKRFVSGAYKSGYGLGTYGYDARTRTAWAVVDHDGSFAIDGLDKWHGWTGRH